MKSRMRIVLIVFIIIATLAWLLTIWSTIDPVILAQLTGSVWAVGIAAIAIGYLTQEHSPQKDQF